MTNTHELTIAAEEAAFNLPDEDEERFNALQDQLQDSPWLEEVEQREELLDALQNTITVSPEVSAICTAEMEQAKKRGWAL